MLHAAKSLATEGALESVDAPSVQGQVALQVAVALEAAGAVTVRARQEGGV